MAEETARITVRLPLEYLQKLEQIQKKNNEKNLSEVIRRALDDYIQKQLPPENITMVTLALPKSLALKLEAMISEGMDAVSIEEAIRNAIRDYLEKKLKEIATVKSQ
ncbi:MAG: ribbon-helix-helix domain-containing protein [Thermoplasmata archaeon]|nr:ribbon-helix-helix domain-containing protein [Thermoplasmata archaeon]